MWLNYNLNNLNFNRTLIKLKSYGSRQYSRHIWANYKHLETSLRYDKLTHILNQNVINSINELQSYLNQNIGSINFALSVREDLQHIRRMKLTAINISEIDNILKQWLHIALSPDNLSLQSVRYSSSSAELVERVILRNTI